MRQGVAGDENLAEAEQLLGIDLARRDELRGLDVACGEVGLLVKRGGDPAGGGGLRLVTDRLSVSPGRTCNVGDSMPSGVTKQKSVRPALSTVV